MKFPEDSASFYDNQTKSANPIRSWWHKTRHKTILELVTKYNDGGQIADLGCSNCTWNYGRTFKKVIGIDKNKAALDYAQKLGRIQQSYTCDLANTPLPNNSCSLVILSEVLEHTKSPEQVLDEAKRILDWNSYLIVSVPYDTNLSLWKPLFTLQCIYWGNIKGSKYYKQHCGHIHHFSPASLKRILEDAGFDIHKLFSIKRFTIFAVAQKGGKYYARIHKR